MSDIEDTNYHSCEDNDMEEFKKENLDLISQLKYKNYFYTSYFIQDGKEFILSVRPWTFNNPLNSEHIDRIYSQLKQDPYLTGVFSVVCLSDNSIVLIDGHHRHQALIQLIQDGYEEEIPIEVHCYQSDTINSKNTISLFTKLNNTKPFNNSIIVLLSIEIIKMLKEKFPNNIRPNSKRVVYTNILEKDLNDQLQKKLETLIRIQHIDKDDIYQKILTFNEEYKSRAETIVKRNKKQDWNKIKKRLIKNDCYLGIVPISEWINKLE